MIVDCSEFATEKIAPPLKFVKEVEDMTTSLAWVKTHPEVMLCSFPMNSQFMMLTEVLGSATRLGTRWIKFFGRDLKDIRQLRMMSPPFLTRTTVSMFRLMSKLMIDFGFAFVAFSKTNCS